MRGRFGVFESLHPDPLLPAKRPLFGPRGPVAGPIGTAYHDNLDSRRSLYVPTMRLAFKDYVFASCHELVGGDGSGLDNAGFAQPIGAPNEVRQKAKIKTGGSGEYEQEYSLLKRLP